MVKVQVHGEGEGDRERTVDLELLLEEEENFFQIERKLTKKSTLKWKFIKGKLV